VAGGGGDAVCVVVGPVALADVDPLRAALVDVLASVAVQVGAPRVVRLVPVRCTGRVLRRAVKASSLCPMIRSIVRVVLIIARVVADSAVPAATIAVLAARLGAPAVGLI